MYIYIYTYKSGPHSSSRPLLSEFLARHGSTGLGWGAAGGVATGPGSAGFGSSGSFCLAAGSSEASHKTWVEAGTYTKK